MTTPEGQPESGHNGQAANGYLPDEVEWDPVVPEQSPLTPVFDELTRQRTAEIIARYPQSRSALLPLLHLVQSVEGYVSQDGIRYCAEVLELTTAEVSAVATFYTMYKRTPCGEHLVSVCTNTLCAALGGDDIYARLSRKLGVGHEETYGDPGSRGSITLEHAECLAACDLAPVLQVNYEYFDNQTVESAEALVEALAARREAAAHPGCPADGPEDGRAGAGRDLPGSRHGRAGQLDVPRDAARRPPGERARLGGARDAGQAARPAGPAGEEVT